MDDERLQNATSHDQLHAFRELAKERSHTGLAGSAPWLGTDGSADPDDVAAVLVRSIAVIADNQLRAAAQALFPLPYADSPGSLSERRRRAAEIFYVSPSTFRSGTPTTPSREDVVLAEVARQVARTTAPARSTARRTPAIMAAVALGMLVFAPVVLSADRTTPKVHAAERPTKPEVRATQTDSGAGFAPSEEAESSATTTVTSIARSQPAAPADEPRLYLPGSGSQPASVVAEPVDRSHPTGGSGRGSGSPASIAITPANVDPSADPNFGAGHASPAEPSPAPAAPAAPAVSPPDAEATPDAVTPREADATPVATPDDAPVRDPSIQPPPGPERSTTTTSSTTSTTTTSTTTATPGIRIAGVPEAPQLACPGRNLAVDPVRLERVRALMIELGRPSDVCQHTAENRHWDLNSIRFLVDGDTTPWIDLVFDDGRSMVIPNRAWTPYRWAVNEFGGLGKVGHPATWRLRPDGSSELTTEHGVVLGGGTTDTVHFAVSPPFVALWLANRDELGTPMTHSTPLSSEFEGGQIEVIDGELQLSLTSPEEARAMLPSDDALAGSIIRQPRSTAWYVDSQLRRWWIPDGGVWGCLGGSQNMSTNQLEGAAVASLPLAGLAHCGLR